MHTHACRHAHTQIHIHTETHKCTDMREMFILCADLVLYLVKQVTFDKSDIIKQFIALHKGIWFHSVHPVFPFLDEMSGIFQVCASKGIHVYVEDQRSMLSVFLHHSAPF